MWSSRGRVRCDNIAAGSYDYMCLMKCYSNVIPVIPWSFPGKDERSGQMQTQFAIKRVPQHHKKALLLPISPLLAHYWVDNHGEIPHWWASKVNGCILKTKHCTHYLSQSLSLFILLCYVQVSWPFCTATECYQGLYIKVMTFHFS